jgi:Holliday junction resolvasome RuvABC endonuclease subunit
MSSERGSTIGIDPSVNAPAFAVWPAATTYQVKTWGQGSERLTALYDLTFRHMEYAPDDLEAVFIERPVGRFPKRALDQACGILQVAVVKGLEERFDHPVSIFELSPSAWKKGIGLSGAAKKMDVAAWALVQDGLKPEPLTQDEMDALAIAAAGHSLVRTGQI